MLRSIRSIFLSVLLILFACMAVAGTNRWTTNGPFGATLRSFTFHPRLDNIVFASGGHFIDGLFRSKDAGVHWQRLNISGGVRAHGNAFSVRIHPRNPDVILAGGHQIYRSTDLGDTWQVISEDLPGGISEMEFDPQDPQTLFVVTVNPARVLKSSDGGSTWVEKSDGIAEGCCARVPELEVHPSNGKIVYILGSDSQVYKTTNGGESWKTASKGLQFERDQLDALVIDPRSPETLYLGAYGTSDGVFKTTNGGGNWFSTKCECNAIDIAIDPADSRILYVTGDSSPRKSTDAGKTWTALGISAPIAALLNATEVHPRQKNIVLISTYSMPLLRSTNAAASFQILAQRLDGLDLTQIFSIDARRLLAREGTNGILYESVNGGKSWKISNLMNLTGLIGDIDVHPQQTRFVIVSHDFVSTDGGRTWNARFDARLEHQLPRFHSSNPSIIYSAAVDRKTRKRLGIFKSVDLGNTYKAVNRGLTDKQVTAIGVDPKIGENVFAGTNSGRIFRTTNGGKSWKKVSTGLPVLQGSVDIIVISPQNSSLVYAFVAGRLFKSSNAGVKWEQKLAPSNFIRSINIDKRNPRILFAGTFGSVLISTDEGENWSVFDTKGLGAFFTGAVINHPVKPDAYFLSTERGIFSYSISTRGDSPSIQSLFPSPSNPGNVVQVQGRNFGPVPGNSKLLLGSLEIAPSNWSENLIEFTVPENANTENLVIRVNGNKSNPFELIIRPTDARLAPVRGRSKTPVTLLVPSDLSETNFNVAFGSNLASDVRFIPPDILVCKAPSGSGEVQVVIHRSTNAGSETIEVGTFEYAN